MLNERRLRQVVRRMNGIAGAFNCKVELGRVDLEKESFVVTLKRDGKDAPTSNHRFTCLEDDMVKLGRCTMTPSPSLMFGAIFV